MYFIGCTMKKFIVAVMLSFAFVASAGFDVASNAFAMGNK